MKKIINFEDYWPEENRDVVVPVDLIPVPEVIKPQRKSRNVKEGLWFKTWEDGLLRWSTIIPRKVGFDICYDGEVLGRQLCIFDLIIYHNKPYIIVLKSRSPLVEGGMGSIYKLDRLLTLDDFDIIPNPDYQE